MKLRIALVMAMACSLALPAPAAAEDAGLARAEEYFNRGQALYSAGKYAEAAQEFERAYEARALTPFLFNIGASYEKLARSEPGNAQAWESAISYYRRYLEAEPGAKDSPTVSARIKVLETELERIRKVVAEQKEAPEQVKASARVEALEDAVIRGLVVIESDPPGAMIYIGDRSKGPVSKTPWSGALEGEHSIYIVRPGYKPREMKIAPAPDKLVVLSIALAEEDYLGWIDITSNVPGADIYIGDKSVGVFGRTPFSGNIKPGKHRVWITVEGYDEYTTTVEIVAGKTHVVSAQLKGSPVGYLDVRGSGIEQSTVYLDGVVLCETGPCRKPVREGRHKVTVKRSGYKTYEHTVNVQPKTETMIRVQLASEPSRSDAVWAYLFAGGFAGGGVYLGLQARSLHDEVRAEIEAGAPPPDSSDPRIQRGKLYALGADVGYGLAGVTLLTAVYYTFRDKGPPSTGSIDMSAVALQPRLGPGFAGLGVEVSW